MLLQAGLIVSKADVLQVKLCSLMQDASLCHAVIKDAFNSFTEMLCWSRHTVSCKAGLPCKLHC